MPCSPKWASDPGHLKASPLFSWDRRRPAGGCLSLGEIGIDIRVDGLSPAVARKHLALIWVGPSRFPTACLT
jgi:hypothetical protein